MNNHETLHVLSGVLRRIRQDPWVRRAGKLLLDGGLAAVAWGVAHPLLGPGAAAPGGMLRFAGAAMAFNILFRFTGQHYRLLGLSEALGLLAGTFAMAGAAAWYGVLAGGGGKGPAFRGALLVASLLTGCSWLALRGAVSGFHRWNHRRTGGLRPREKRALIVGAGRAGMRLSQELRENPRVGYEVVGFVDDAPEKQGLRIQGIPVLGTTERLKECVASHRVGVVILGMAGASGNRLRALSQDLQTQGIPVKTVPGILDLVGNRPWRPEVRDIAIEDLLRREPVTLDVEAIRQALEGSVTLITGAGGSIGSELARRVASFRPGTLILLGRGENSLWEVERSLRRTFPGQALTVCLCDIRDRRRIRQVFEEARPQVVFHAAAHKHLPYLEVHPEEAIGNNIFGTLHVVRAALRCGTRTFVNVSTDKAVNPSSVLGVSKRIGEQVVLQAAAEAPEGSRFVSVRFGNVLGSRGSVIPVFQDQIRQGGPLTVTHPDMLRYFMTIPEACQLVMQAGVLGATGKVFALDMGDPVRILDLARDMARLSGVTPGGDLEIRFTGIRPGEKLAEELFGDRERRRPGGHPKVFEAVQDPLGEGSLEKALAVLRALAGLPEAERKRAMIRCFQDLVPTYEPSREGLGRFLVRAEGIRRSGRVPAPRVQLPAGS